MDFFLDQTNLILIFTAVASGVMLMLPNLLKGGGRGVGVSQAVQLANQQQGLFVDVRPADAFKAGTIPQARHLPAADIQAKLKSLPQDKPIILFCEQGRESGRLAAALRKQGYGQAVCLDGGLRAWTEAGMPVSKKH